MARQKVGLTGASGVLGRSIQRWWPDVEWVPFAGDVRDVRSLERWMAPDFAAVIHLAAIVPVEKVSRDLHQAVEINIMGTNNVLDSARQRLGAKSWIFIASSSHVYRPSDKPIAESDRLEPPTLYGLTKLHAEQLASAYAATYDLPVSIGRIFSYGSPLQSRSYFLPSIVSRIRLAPSGGTISLRGARQVRDFLDTQSISDAIRHLYERRSTGPVNIASGTGVSILEVAEKVAAALGRNDVSIVPADEKEGGLVADVEVIRSSGWERRFDLSELIGEMVDAIAVE